MESRENFKIIYGVVHNITARKEAEAVIVRYSERLEILRQIEQGILSAQSVEEIGQVAMGRIRRLIPCHSATVTVFDYRANEAVVVTGETDTVDRPIDNIRTKLGQMGRPKDRFNLLRQGKVIILDEVELARDYREVRERSIRSVMVAPLLYQAELVGTLNLSATEAGTFTPDHQEIAGQVADQLAIAIRQADLYAQTQQHAAELEQRVTDRTRELQALYEVSSVASELLEMEPMLERCLMQILDALGSKVGLIFLREEPDQPFALVSQQGLPRTLISSVEKFLWDQGLLDRVVENNGPVIISDLDHLFGSMPQLRPDSFGGYAGAPIRASGQLMGILNTLSSPGRQFNIEELALLASVADQIGVAVENVRLREQAEKAAVLAERERLARELHDSVTQSLYSLTLFSEGSLELAKQGEMIPIEHNLTRISQTAQQALKEMRLLVYELRPPDLEQEGLVGVLHQRLAAVEKRAGLNARLVAEELVELSPEVEQELFGIVQEALNNIIKHAGATSVSVHLWIDGQKIVVEIVDDGRGFDPEAVKGQGGLGLISIRDRVEKLGGSLEIFSAPDEGTTIHVEIEG
jgi:signal transduction histidine kinase